MRDNPEQADVMEPRSKPAQQPCGSIFGLEPFEAMWEQPAASSGRVGFAYYPHLTLSYLHHLTSCSLLIIHTQDLIHMIPDSHTWK